jgi:acetyl esterase/lipase
MRRNLVYFLAVGALLASDASGQLATGGLGDRVERNVVYAMYSGAALLMDVYHPVTPNGIGIVYIAGSAWHSSLDYNATPLKELPLVAAATAPLVEAGYTVFAINHRNAPRFRYPGPIEDAQRAVRFVRHHADRFGIRPGHIGAAGHSSGACLALLLGVLDGVGEPGHTDLVERESAKVQAVASLAAPTDFINVPASFAQSSYLGVALFDRANTSTPEYMIYRDASPVSHATAGDAPILLMHGDADPIVPFRNSALMRQALEAAGVTVRQVNILGGGHFPPFPPDEPDPFIETVRWFDEHLGAGAALQQTGSTQSPLCSLCDPTGAKMALEREALRGHDDRGDAPPNEGLLTPRFARRR